MAQSLRLLAGPSPAVCPQAGSSVCGSVSSSGGSDNRSVILSSRLCTSGLCDPRAHGNTCPLACEGFTRLPGKEGSLCVPCSDLFPGLSPFQAALCPIPTWREEDESVPGWMGRGQCRAGDPLPSPGAWTATNERVFWIFSGRVCDLWSSPWWSGISVLGLCKNGTGTVQLRKPLLSTYCV